MHFVAAYIRRNSTLCNVRESTVYLSYLVESSFFLPDQERLNHVELPGEGLCGVGGSVTIREEVKRRLGNEQPPKEFKRRMPGQGQFHKDDEEFLGEMEEHASANVKYRIVTTTSSCIPTTIGIHESQCFGLVDIMLA